MSQPSDATLKREYCEYWLDQHAEYQVHLVDQGSAVNVAECLSKMRRLVEGQQASEYIYILVEEHPEGRIPAYVGKSRHPLTRWRSHLQKLQQGEGSYARWRERLLLDNAPRFNLPLFVVGENSVLFPPIPDFPTTIGAVEYQLIGLIEDAYPIKLLNHEGQSR